MFHVSALIDSKGPADPTRKRHIGNDVVVVVFNESGGPFDPTQVLRSHFTHVYVVVARDPGSKDTLYEVEVFVRAGVANVPPYLPAKQPMRKGHEFEEWLIAKSTPSPTPSLLSAQPLGTHQCLRSHQPRDLRHLLCARFCANALARA